MIKSFIPRLAEIGKIKIGGKGDKRKSSKGNEFRMPIKYDHFVITKTEKDLNDNLIIDGEVMKKLGEKPKEIKIKLLYDSIELNFLNSFEMYKGKKCICRGNGEKALRKFKDGTEKEIECNIEKCEFPKSNECKPSGILSCILADSNQIGGVYKLRTHSWNSVQNILGSLTFIKLQTGGKLAGIPLTLKLLKKATSEHGNVNTVNIVFNGNQEALIKAVKEEENRRKGIGFKIEDMEKAAVKSGIINDNDDPEEVEDEFYRKNDAKTPKIIDANKFEVSANVKKTKEIKDNGDNISDIL